MSRTQKTIFSIIILVVVGLTYFFIPARDREGNFTFDSCNDAVLFRETKALADYGRPDMSQTFQFLPGDTSFVDGRQYPNKPVGTSLMAVPFYYLGEFIARLQVPRQNHILDAKLNADKLLPLTAKPGMADATPVAAWPFSVKDSSLNSVGLAITYTSLEKKPLYSLEVKIVFDNDGRPDQERVVGSPHLVSAGEVVLGLGKYTPIPYQAELQPDQQYWLVVQAEADSLKHDEYYLLTVGQESPDQYGLQKKMFGAEWEPLERAPFMVLESDPVVTPTTDALEYAELPYEIYATTFLSLLAAVFSVWLVFQILHQIFRLSFSASWLSALIFGFGTLIWRYSSFLFVHNLALCLVLLTLYLTWYGLWRKKGWLWYLWPGLAAGYSVFVDYTNLFVVAGIGIYLIIISFRSLVPKEGLARLGGYVLGGVPSALAIAWYQWSAFGSPLATSYRYYPDFPLFLARSDWFKAPYWNNLWEMFFGRLGIERMDGLFVAVPVVLLSLAGLVVWYRRQRGSALLILGIEIILLGFASFLLMVFGGGTKDYRYLLTAAGLFFLPLGFFIDQYICNRLARGWNLLLHIIFWFMAAGTIYLNIYYTLGQDPLSFLLGRQG